jgi:hypothetical protein
MEYNGAKESCNDAKESFQNTPEIFQFINNQNISGKLAYQEYIKTIPSITQRVTNI